MISSGLLLSLALAAPVPKPVTPDPLGQGFMGVYPVSESVEIMRVEPGTAAARAGLMPGDVFVMVGTIQPGDFNELRLFVSGLRPGTKITLQIRRKGQVISKVLQLGSRADSVTLRDDEP